MSKMRMSGIAARNMSAVLLALVAGVASAAGPEDAQKFLVKSYQDGVAEIRLCNLALQKSQNPDVKKFAERMIRDHTNADAKIEAIARDKRITLPTNPSLKQTATYDMLALKSGPGFDATFMEHNVSDHEGDVKEFTSQVRDATDPAVKAFASRMLVTLKAHLKLSRSVRAQVQKSQHT